MIKKKRHGIHSLYLGLISNIIFAIVAAVVAFIICLSACNHYINNHYLSYENQQTRIEAYLRDLQEFVTRRGMTFDNADEIKEWAKTHSYVYLLVQKDDQMLYPSDIEDDNSKDDEDDKTTDDGEGKEDGEKDPDSSDTTDKDDETGSEDSDTDKDKENDKDKDKDKEQTGGGGIGDVIGGFTDTRPSREELIAQAQANGLHEIELADGTVFVSITEFTQTIYVNLSRILSVLAGCLVLSIILVNYFRIIIRRIKKLENDVNIVSHDDMNHVIVGKGKDEIANLSRNVEIMRNTMLENIKNEQEAREANTELITSISHDIRTPLTVLMGYVEMMKSRSESDEVMARYVQATESTAQRLKQLSDDMFRYSLAFGDTEKGIMLEEYDTITLLEQLFAEHILLLREQGMEISTEQDRPIKEGSTVLTDAQNLMRIVDNVFSNLRKYADRSEPVLIRTEIVDDIILIEVKNKIRTEKSEAESNGIGLKTCVRLGSLISEGFEYEKGVEYFTARIKLKIKEP